METECVRLMVGVGGTERLTDTVRDRDVDGVVVCDVLGLADRVIVEDSVRVPVGGTDCVEVRVIETDRESDRVTLTGASAPNATD